MSLISKLKRLIFGPSRRDQQTTRVPVEREPAAESERAVKEPAPAGSDEVVEEPEPEPAPAAETEAEPAPEAEAEPAPEAEAEPAPEAEAEPSDDADEPVESITGIGPAYAERLNEAGVETVGELAASDAAELAEATGVGEGRVSDWIERAKGD